MGRPKPSLARQECTGLLELNLQSCQSVVVSLTPVAPQKFADGG